MRWTSEGVTDRLETTCLAPLPRPLPVGAVGLGDTPFALTPCPVPAAGGLLGGMVKPLPRPRPGEAAGREGWTLIPLTCPLPVQAVVLVTLCDGCVFFYL